MKRIKYLFLIILLQPLLLTAQDTINNLQLSLAKLELQLYNNADSLVTNALKQKTTINGLVLKADIMFAQQNYLQAAQYYAAANKQKTAIAGLKLAKAYTLANMYDSAFAALAIYVNHHDRISMAKIAAEPTFAVLQIDSRWQNIINKPDINTYQKDLERAAHLINTHRNSEAYIILNQVIKKHSSSHYAWYLRALAYFNDDNLKSALYDIERAIKLQSRNAQYINLLADIYYKNKKYNNAIEKWLLAIKLDELQIHNYLSIAKAFLETKNYNQAQKYAQLYLLMFPKSEAIYILAQSFAEQGFYVDALKTLNLATENSATFYRQRGIIYLKSETYQYAINDFNTAIDLNPTLYDVYLHRGLAYYYIGNKQQAHNDWKIALSHRIYKANDYLEKYR